jgi:hypothetical protein
LSESALLAELHAMLNDPHYDPVAAIVEGERKRGFRVVRPGDEPWFRIRDWRAESVVSIDGNTVRLVLIHAVREGRGTFTHTVQNIEKAGLLPSVIEPNREFAASLKRRGWVGKQVGRTFETRETVWRPK